MPKIASQLEGVITDLPVMEGANVVLMVLGVKVVVFPSAADRRRIRTSTKQKRLKLAQLVDATSLPGRVEKGFVGCTAIVSGNYDTQAKVLEVEYPPTKAANQPAAIAFENHPFLEVGPPESLLLGACTSNVAGKIQVNQIEVEILPESSDPNDRLHPETPTNEFGIKIDMTKVPIDAPISIEGYLSTSGPTRFIGFNVVVDSNDPDILLDPIRPQIGITRAMGRNRASLFDLEVRGGVYTGRTVTPTIPQRITIQRLNKDGLVEGDPAGIISTRANAPAGGFDTWTAKGQLTATPPFLTSPVGVQATYFNAAFAIEPAQERDVDIRDDPKTPPTASSPP